MILSLGKINGKDRKMIAFLSGFMASAALFDLSHRRGFPELARYAIGCVLVLAVYALSHPDDKEQIKRLALTYLLVGCGVGAARVGRMVLALYGGK